MDKTVFRFRGKVLSTLGELLDEVCRIANDAPEDAEDFLNGYCVNMMRINETTLENAEKIVRVNIRYLAGYAIGTNNSQFNQIMQVFYPLTCYEVG